MKTVLGKKDDEPLRRKSIKAANEGCDIEMSWSNFSGLYYSEKQLDK